MLSLVIFVGTVGLLHLLVVSVESARASPPPCALERHRDDATCECHKRSL